MLLGSQSEKRNSGGRSSVGRALDCDSSGRGFKPHRPPHFSFSLGLIHAHREFKATVLREWWNW
jgi:hypothetical protein